jgi:hypothetical protein
MNACFLTIKLVQIRVSFYFVLYKGSVARKYCISNVIVIHHDYLFLPHVFFL